MRRNALWIIFLLIVAFLAFWFIIKAGSAVFSYFQLTNQVPISINKWSVEEVHSDQFVVKVDYSYLFQNKDYHGSGQVGDTYPNPWAANRALQQFSKQDWSAWINPKQPQNSVLEKKFPFKKAISATILIGLFIYFLILNIYVKVKHE